MKRVWISALLICFGYSSLQAQSDSVRAQDDATRARNQHALEQGEALDDAGNPLPPPNEDKSRIAPPLERGEYRGAGIKLHRPDGSEIYANPRAIAFVRLPMEGETGNSVVVFANGGKQSVKEKVPDVIDLIAAERYIIAPVAPKH
jgi:uncharacterized protein YlzI (FlbEa/FlbD family)